MAGSKKTDVQGATDGADTLAAPQTKAQPNAPSRPATARPSERQNAVKRSGKKPGRLLRRHLHAYRQRKLTPEQIEESQQLVVDRTEQLDRLNLQVADELPVAQAQAEIRAAIQAHPVVIVAGETGSGKTTQLPKLCLQLGLGRTGMVGHTQPRRLAARTIASRLSTELGAEATSSLSDAVGVAMRFTDTVAPTTLVKLMTDGLLLTELRRDRYLSQYDVLIIDEAHERSLNIDFLLGYLKRLLGRRRDLKVVITSATIDVERFSAFFQDAPIIEVGGRTYPVETVYQPGSGDLIEDIGDVLEDIDTRPHQGARDVLTFLSGEREIFEAAKGLRERFAQRFEILPLYARLSAAEQRKIFAPGGPLRRVILATNVAETSVTVPNIGFVIDPGFHRINRYSYRSKLERLPIEAVSQASANQRQGRCGRIAPGVCFRLYEESDFAGRPAFSDPEIRRVNLASVVLQMHAFNLGEIQRFPFIDPPEPRAVKDALRLLDELQALKNGKLTQIGREMARLPVDPRLARMLVTANQQGSLTEMLIITAGLSVQDPRERPMQKAQAADQAHLEFQDERSDFLGWIKFWNWLEEQRQQLTNNQFKRLLQKRYINFVRVREWREVYRQLRSVCRELKYRENTEPAGYAAIHESVVAGSLSLIAQHDERGQYVGARNLKLRIFPGSGVAKTPKWIVAGEIAETSRVFARSVARIEAAWVERHAQHLIKKQFSEPHWSSKRGEVMAHVSISLYGLRLAENRRVSFARENPDLCREIFIRDGLIAGAIEAPPDFLVHNLKLVADVLELEAKGRRRDVLVDDEVIHEFYAERIPPEVMSVSDLKHWLRRANNATVAELFLDRATLQKVAAAELTEQAYPGALEVDGVALRLAYRFAPGEKDDGVSILVPVGVVPALHHEWLEWSVPGFFSSLIEAWLRTLPKQKRKQLAPIADKLDELTQHLLDTRRYRQGRLLSALQTLLADWYRVQVGEGDWDRSRVPEHLLLNVKIQGEGGKLLRQGRDLRVLRRALDGTATEVAPANIQAQEQRDIQALPTTGLDDYVLVGPKGTPVMRFPGLADQDGQVDLKLFETRRARDLAHRQGLTRLALKRLGQVSRYFRRELDKHPRLGLHYAALGSADDLKHQILGNVIWFTFFEDQPPVLNDADLDTRLVERRPQLADIFNTTVALAAEVYELRFRCLRRLDEMTSKAYGECRSDVSERLQALVPGNCLSITPYRYLRLLPRLLEGYLHRLERLAGHVQTDSRRLAEIQPLQLKLAEIGGTELADPTRQAALAMLLEEVRLQTFAAQVAKQKFADHPLDNAYFGPKWKASVKRCEELLRAEAQRCGVA